MKVFSHNWWARIIRAPFCLVFGSPQRGWPVACDWTIYRLAQLFSLNQTGRIHRRWMRELNG